MQKFIGSILLAVMLSGIFACGSNSPMLPDEGRIPDDPLFYKQWHLHNNKPGSGGINLPLAWEITTGSPDITIAIVDNEFDIGGSDLGGSPACKDRYSHVEIFSKRQPTKTDKHGQKVMGAVVACTNNSTGIAGVDWLAKSIGVEPNAVAESSLVSAIKWAAGIPVNGALVQPSKGADVINLSYGGVQHDASAAEELAVIQELNKRGLVFVTSSGNDAKSADTQFLNDLPGVIAVGASDQFARAANFSNWGRSVNILAPGQALIADSAVPSAPINGTSFSSPIAAGVISLMKSVYPNRPEFNWKVAEYILESTASPINCDNYCPKSYETAPQRNSAGEVKGTKNVRAGCQKECCDANKVNNICTSGIVDALAAVTVAQNGVPNVPLIDAEPYFIKIPSSTTLAPLNIFNRGGVAAVVTIKSDDPKMSFLPDKVALPAHVDGKVDSRIVVLAKYDLTGFIGKKSLRIALEARNPDRPDDKPDTLRLYVGVGSSFL